MGLRAETGEPSVLVPQVLSLCFMSPSFMARFLPPGRKGSEGGVKTHLPLESLDALGGLACPGLVPLATSPSASHHICLCLQVSLAMCIWDSLGIILCFKGSGWVQGPNQQKHIQHFCYLLLQGLQLTLLRLLGSCHVPVTALLLSAFQGADGIIIQADRSLRSAFCRSTLRMRSPSLTAPCLRLSPMAKY